MRTRIKGTCLARWSSLALGMLLVSLPSSGRAELPTGETLQITPRELLGRVNKGESIELRTSTRTLRISLRRADVRKAELVPRTRLGARLATSKASLFVGEIEGVKNSSARLAFGRDGVRGVITLPGERLWLEPSASNRPSGRTGGIAHRLASTEELERAVGAVGLCDSTPHAAHAEVAATGPESSETRRGTLPPIASTELRRVELAVEVDARFMDRFGAATGEVVDSIVHGANEIFERELGLSVTISALIVEDGGTSRYRETDPVSLLGELRELWIQDRRAVARDAVHLFTGRALDGNSGGIAYVGTTCDPSWGFGLTHVYDSIGLTAMVLSHELAHNLGARHDEGDSPFLMAPSLSPRTLAEFSEASQLEIGSFAAGAACLDAAAIAPETGGNGFFARGDANGDAEVDLADASYILSYLFAGASSPDCPDALDTDDNGLVELTDALRVVLYLLSAGAPPSAPFPISGVDPTGDRLAPCAR